MRESAQTKFHQADAREGRTEQTTTPVINLFSHGYFLF